MRLVAIVLMLLVPAAAAAEARRFAVLSLIGDELTVAAPVLTTASRMERSPRTVVRVDDPVLDHAALLAADDALRGLEPGTKPVLLAARNPAHLAEQAKALDDPARFRPMVEAIRGSLGDVAASHLVLVAKYRHEAAIELQDGRIGSGKLQGLGFYVDPDREIVNRETGATSRGFIAPFAYFRVLLVDLATGRIEGDEPVIAAYAHTLGDADNPDPWKGLSAGDKVRILRELVRAETLRAVPRVLRR